MQINFYSCRICFTNERLKLLSLFSVKIDDQSLADVLSFLSGIGEIALMERIF